MPPPPFIPLPHRCAWGRGRGWGGVKAKSVTDYEPSFIGEATKNLPTAVRKRYPDVPWSSMARMRDRLSHGYWEVDYEIVWKVVREELPALRPRLQEICRIEAQRI
ncbi:MAG: DUF86 domain-containing protein [Anaerolineae bacterium]